MQVQTKLADGVLYIKLIGELDEYSSAQLRQKCDKLIDGNAGVDKIIINLAEVAFMDSAGIGFLIGRYKKAARLGIGMFVEQPNFAADKILNLSGIYTLIPKTR